MRVFRMLIRNKADDKKNGGNFISLKENEELKTQTSSKANSLLLNFQYANLQNDQIEALHLVPGSLKLVCDNSAELSHAVLSQVHRGTGVSIVSDVAERYDASSDTGHRTGQSCVNNCPNSAKFPSHASWL
ncbi:uncharacterized protein V6R79_010636 [Siganus canaliculatus]